MTRQPAGESQRKNAPHLVIVAGPNGAGKSTWAPRLLRDAMKVREFVNADTIAIGLSAFHADSVGLAAGRVMLARLHELAADRADFAFETTLATRSFAPWIAGMRQKGYRVSLVFLWLPDVDLAVGRVASRVLRGGHGIPPEVVRRRYERGLRNFFALYRPLTDHWRLMDNSRAGRPRLIAAGGPHGVEVVRNAASWEEIQAAYGSQA